MESLERGHGVWDDHELSDDIDVDSESSGGNVKINGLTNSARRLSLKRVQMLRRMSQQAVPSISQVLSGIRELELCLDKTLEDNFAQSSRDGFSLDEQTVEDLLKMAGACSAMRQQIVIIAETVNEFDIAKKGA